MSRRLVLLSLPLLLAGCPIFLTTTNTVTRGVPECRDGDQVRVRFSTCLSSSCDSLRQATCVLSLDGDTAHIEGSAEIESSRGGACTADCGFVEATCSGQLGPAVIVRFGEESKETSALPPCPSRG